MVDANHAAGKAVLVSSMMDCYPVRPDPFDLPFGLSLSKTDRLAHSGNKVTDLFSVKTMVCPRGSTRRRGEILAASAPWIETTGKY
jgi:hypothetical protein